jgi:putative transposase
MGSVGDSFDNALAENFFSILKVERVYRTSYRTREEAELEAYYTGKPSGSLAPPTGAT